MVNFDQGPGRNIEFCLITTGINIDPNHGCFSRELYQWLKNVILQRAEIHFENRIIREIHDVDVSNFLKGYEVDVRTVYQFLFGLVEHSNGWDEESLTRAIDKTPFPRSLDPEDGHYSIDLNTSKEAGLTLFENQLFGMSNVWIEKQEFYYSSCKPQLLDGETGDVWIVSDGFDVELWYKPAFEWIRLEDYVKQRNPPGTVSYQDTDPGNAPNSWWLDTTGLNIRKYSVSANAWETFTSVTVSPVQPIGLSDGDLWVRIINGKFALFVFEDGGFKRRVFSIFPVQDRATNSAFDGTSENNNFVIICGDGALLGLPLVITGETTLKIRKDGILIQTAVDCINFVGPDFDVTAAGVGEAIVEHLPITTLPEQGGAPSSTTDAGKVFTLDIGGITELFYIDSSGNLTQLTNGGTTAQNIFFAISTAAAVPGQTVFSVPATATAILTFKINGVDTTAFTFSSPSVTYNPALGGYVIQTGDVVTILYYGQ